MHYKIIALIGESGSGKDTLMQGVLSKTDTLHEIISCTTRPKREGEQHGVNYFFMTPEQFADKVVYGEMLEAACFNDWLYGTSYESLRSDVVNIGVFNPQGIESLLHSPNVEIKVFYIKTSDKIRLLRQLNREQNPDIDEIIRRYKTDREDFYDLDFEYIQLKNDDEEDLQTNINIILDNLL